jgi:hypothetical protein
MADLFDFKFYPVGIGIARRNLTELWLISFKKNS